MQKHKSLIFALALLIMASVACDGSNEINSVPSYSSIPTPTNPFPKGDRILELDANASQNQDFDQAMDLARDLGAEFIRISVFWDDIETEPGIYNPDPNWLAIANQYYSSHDLAISLTISVLDTTEIRVPGDLVDRSFSDPEMQNRIRGLLDYVKTQLVDVDLTYLAIGNEIDGVLGNDLTFWNDYRDFFDPAAEYARELWPDLPVSTKVTFYGLTGPDGGRCLRHVSQLGHSDDHLLSIEWRFFSQGSRSYPARFSDSGRSLSRERDSDDRNRLSIRGRKWEQPRTTGRVRALYVPGLG